MPNEKNGGPHRRKNCQDDGETTAESEKTQRRIGRHLNEKDIALITRQLAMMLRSGLPVMEALTIMEKGATAAPALALLRRLRMDVSAGMPLSAALNRHPDCFDEAFCGVVRAGEHAGSLDALLERLATQQEKHLMAKRRLKTALIQPAVTLFFAIAVMTFILPGFAALGITLSIIVAALFATHRYRHSPAWRDGITLVAFRIPILGAAMQKILVTRWCRIIATLHSAGVPLSGTLDTALNVTGVSLYQTATQQIRDKVAAGGSFADALKNTHIFPDLIAQMAHRGEQSGELDSALNKGADFLEAEAEESLKRLFSIMVPVLLILLGCLVAYTMISAMTARLEGIP